MTIALATTTTTIILIIIIIIIVVVSPCNLTLADVDAPLGHEAHPPLWLLTAECAEVVNVRRLVCDLKVTDAAVALNTHTHTQIVSSELNSHS